MSFHDFSLEAAGFADRLVAATPDRLSSVHAARLVQEARLYFDPDPDRATAEDEATLARRGVWLRPGGALATTEGSMTRDTPRCGRLRRHRGPDRPRPG